MGDEGQVAGDKKLGRVKPKRNKTSRRFDENAKVLDTNLREGVIIKTFDHQTGGSRVCVLLGLIIK
jgi:hypothetical protein